VSMRESMPHTQGWRARGSCRAPKPGKPGDVTITDASGKHIRAAYSESVLRRIIEEGLLHPRLLTPEEAWDAEQARVRSREDLRAIEMQFAGIGVSGTYGSLDGRNSRRSQQQERE
jgi:hypothetical protein